MSSITETVASQAITNMRICFYGAGSMAEAIVRGLIHKQLTKPEQISMLNRQNVERLQELHDRYGIQTTMQGHSRDELLRESDVVFLAIKPKDAAEAVLNIKHLLGPNQLVISVVAGLSIDTLTRLIGKSMAIVRTMPNTSSTIGLGVTAISYSDSVTGEQRSLTEQLFGSVGIAEVMDERLQDSATGVSGSGPAYVYYLMEAMMAGAAELGFDEEASRRLVIQTFRGAAEMVYLTGEDPAELRRKVTSPGGTTQAALELMEKGGTKDTIIKAVLRSAERAGELGKDMERRINQ